MLQGMNPVGPIGPRKAVLLGGAHGTLALARCLRRAGFDVCLVTDETSCASFSGAIREVVGWCGTAHAGALDALEAIARAKSLSGGVLIPCADPDVLWVARNHERLSSSFAVMTSGWEQLRWACDKSLAYQRAKELGLGVPRVYERSALAGTATKDLQYPLVLKPSMRLENNRFTADRAWRVDDAASLAERLRAACDLVGAEHVIAQQLIPGGGENQVSYAGLWNSGEPVVGFTARRLRQYPVEFGCTSTYVETARLPDVLAAAETFLRSIRHHGLVEIEFKRDGRDGVLKLLDVNPRPWNWLGLAAPAGVAFGAAIASILSGQPFAKAEARAGLAWIFVSRDLVAALRSGRLSPKNIAGYAASWARVRSFACFSWTDPVPAFADLPLTVARVVHRRGHRSAAAVA
jgi:predicted ATP-grasp superfamily ATP-dependent carboligase